MLIAEVHEPTTRYRLLESLREFAGQHLGTEAAVLGQRHAAYFTAFAEAHGGLALAEDEVSLDNVLAELDNLRAAVTYSITTGDADLALRLAISLQVLWHLYDFAEIGTWAAAAADMEAGTDHPLGPTAHGQAALAATYRLDIPSREHHLARAAGTYWQPYARAYLQRSPEEGLIDIRRAVALVADDDHRARVVIDSYNVLISTAAGQSSDESLERIQAYADVSDFGMLLLRRTEAHLALYRNDHAAALAAYDEVLAIIERRARRSLMWVWASIPRLLLRFEIDPAAALAEARSYLVEARNTGSRRWVQAALARIAVMLARVGRVEPAAVLQSYTRHPEGGAIMADRDPAASLRFETLTAKQTASARARGQRLSSDDAVQLALDELHDAIGATSNVVPPARTTRQVESPHPSAGLQP
jgi:hypothetical protein